MSDAQTYEEVTVDTDGVRVTKRYEADEFPVPAIAFEFASERDEPVVVRLSDDVPADVAVEDLGFHPEYGSEHWSIEDDVITFEREIEPDSEYTTVYGIRATGTDNVDQFLSEPSIDRVAPPLEREEAADEDLVGEGSDAVEEVIGDESDDPSDLDDVDDEDVATLNLNDPDEGAAPSGETARTGSETTSGGGADAQDIAQAAGDVDQIDEETTTENDAQTAPAEGRDLVARMADEIRAGNVNQEDVQLLQKAFEAAQDSSGGDGPTAARIQKLQRDVDEVLAYADALEEFLAENGTGDQLIEDFRGEVQNFRDEVQQFESELDDVTETVEDNEESIEDLSADVENVEGGIEDLSADVENVEDGIENVEDAVEGVEETVEDLEQDVDHVEATVDDVEGTVSTVQTSVDDVEDTVTDLETDVADVREDLADLREDVTDEDVAEQVEEISEEVEELNAWREQLTSVMGAGGTGDDGDD